MSDEEQKRAKVQMVCGDCGSAEVTRDAWAEWEVGCQSWALGAVFDYAFCHRCQRETRIETQAAVSDEVGA